MELPSVWHNDEDIILCKLWWVDHDAVVEETCHLSRTGQYDIRMELGFPSLRHFLAECRPGVRVDGKDDEDLKRVEALERSPGWDSGGKKR